MLKSLRTFSHVCRLKSFKGTKWLMPNGNPTGIYVYNCVASEKVPVILGDPGVATWYSCGPTVYDSSHIGHASCYVKLDIIQRILKSFFNIKLITAMGMTDIDDKIINKANQSNQDFRSIAKKYEQEFWLDMSKLNVEKPLIVTKVSEHISAIIAFVQKLKDLDKAYVAKDGSVYFDTGLFSDYGKLQNMQESATLKSSYKKNEMDFALWKSNKPNEPFWKAPWGKGRPGWHIECSAMVSRIFGSQIDFHAGGIDLQFPHHENEEAQSCAYHNSRQWANYWIHVGHLYVKGDVKMSKSIQNTITIPELLETFNADTFRMACLMSHYRYPMEYSNNFMDTAEDVLNKFKFFLKESLMYVDDASRGEAVECDKLIGELKDVEENIDAALRDDFDTSTCINKLLIMINTGHRVMQNRDSYYPVPILLMSELATTVLRQFGLTFQSTLESTVSNSLVDTLVEFRHSVRMNALSRKDKELLTACDIVRDKMKCFKITINDSSKTASWVVTK